MISTILNWLHSLASIISSLIDKAQSSSIHQLGAAAILFVLCMIALYITRYYLIKLDARNVRYLLVDDTARIIGSTSTIFMLVASFFLAAQVVSLPDRYERFVDGALLFCVALQVAIWLSQLAVPFVSLLFQGAHASNPAQKTTQGVLIFAFKLLVWLVATLVFLDSMGVDITALVAGLGVGGIAVALAVQNLLGDIFSSLSIVLDKPFEVGDFIIVDDFMGEVERIGIKTTRVKSLSGEQLIFSNSDLLSSRIRNYKRMQERRIAFTIGVTYQTPKETMKTLPEKLKTIVEQQGNVRFDRAHFKGFGASSMDLEVVYYVGSREYIEYMDIQQQMNIEIMTLFEELGVEFAYPTQTVFLAGNNQE